jgi:hypothetical protein
MTPGALAWMVATRIKPGSCSVTIRGGKVKVNRAEGDAAARQRALQHRHRRHQDGEGEAGGSSRRLAGGKGQLKVLAVASTGASGQIAQSTRRLTLALGTTTKTRR